MKWIPDYLDPDDLLPDVPTRNAPDGGPMVLVHVDQIRAGDIALHQGPSGRRVVEVWEIQFLETPTYDYDRGHYSATVRAQGQTGQAAVDVWVWIRKAQGGPP